MARGDEIGAVAAYRVTRMALGALNPFRHGTIPALASVVLTIVAFAGGHYLWPIAVVPGVTLCVLGTRIAYAHRGAADFYQYREMVPWWGVGLSVETHRQIEGAVICVFGLFLIGMAAAGVARLA